MVILIEEGIVAILGLVGSFFPRSIIILLHHEEIVCVLVTLSRTLHVQHRQEAYCSLIVRFVFHVLSVTWYLV